MSMFPLLNGLLVPTNVHINYGTRLTLFLIQEENDLIFVRNSTKVLTLIKTFPILIPESLTCVSLLQGTALEAGIFFEHFFLAACDFLPVKS